MSTQQTLLIRRSPVRVAEARDGDFVEVAIDVPVFVSFTYRVPEELLDAIRPGVRLLVPFRGRPRVGIALRRTGPPQDDALLSRVVPVADVLDVEPIISPILLELLEWTAKYYFAPIGEVLRMAIPSALRRAGDRLIELTEAGRVALMTLGPADFAVREEGIATTHRTLQEATVDAEEAMKAVVDNLVQETKQGLNID